MPLPRPATLGAIRVAREAATLIRRSAAPRRLRFKTSSADLVTATDLRVERLVRSWLKATHPSHAVVGEEGGGLAEMDLSRPTGSSTPWTARPTSCAASRTAPARWRSGTVSASRWGSSPMLARRRVYWAEAGRGAYEGRRRLRASPVRRLDRAVLATGFPPTRSFDTDDNLAEFSSVLPAVAGRAADR